MRVLRVNDVELHLREDGPAAGRAIVFSNSLGTDLRVWDALVPHLPGGLHLVRYDTRGHGLSDAPPGPYDIDALAGDAAALIAALGLVRPVFVGLSIGGLTGLALAARHPGRLGGLVLCNSAARIGTPGLWADRVAAVRERGLASIAPATMERWFSPGFRAGGHDAVWSRMMARQPVEGYVACCQAIAGADLRAQAAALSLPVQVVAGGHDGSTPPDLVRATAELIPGARFDLIAEAAHIPCVETPERLAAVLTRFLTEIGHV